MSTRLHHASDLYAHSHVSGEPGNNRVMESLPPASVAPFVASPQSGDKGMHLQTLATKLFPTPPEPLVLDWALPSFTALSQADSPRVLHCPRKAASPPLTEGGTACCQR